MQECIADIEAWTRAGREATIADKRTWVAVQHQLHTLAESSQRLSEDLKARHPGIPWRAIAGARQWLVHGYLVVKPELVWEMVEALPALRACVDQELGGHGDR